MTAAVNQASSVNIAAMKAIAKLMSTVGIGGLASKKGFLGGNEVSVLSKLVYNLFQPCLLFVNIISTVAKNGSSPAIKVLPFVAVIQILLGYIVGKFMSLVCYGRKGQGERSEESKQLITCTTFGNSGPLPLVFTDALFRFHPDPTLLPTSVAYISLYLLGWSPLFWVLATTILSKPGANETRIEKFNKLKGRVLSPPVIASLSALVIGFIHPIRNVLLAGGLLNPVFEAMRTLGNAYLPAVLLVLAGSLLSSGGNKTASPAASGEPSVDLKSLKQIAAVYFSRFFLLPTGAFTIIKLLKEHVPLAAGVLSEPLLVFILLLETCMPSAQNSTVIYNLNGDTQGAQTMARILISVYALGIPAMSFWLAKILKFTALM